MKISAAAVFSQDQTAGKRHIIRILFYYFTLADRSSDVLRLYTPFLKPMSGMICNEYHIALEIGLQFKDIDHIARL